MPHGTRSRIIIPRVKVTTQPAVEPVDTAQAKAHLNLDPAFDDDNALINEMIKAARETAEDYTARKFITQTITAFYDRWPFNDRDLNFTGNTTGRLSSIRGERSVQLVWAPIIDIVEVNTFNEDNTESVYAASNFFLDNADNDMLSRMILNLNSDFPTSLRSSNSFKIEYRAGYGTAGSNVPSRIKRGMLMIVAYLYENRGDCDSDIIAASGAKSYLSDSRILTMK